MKKGLIAIWVWTLFWIFCMGRAFSGHGVDSLLPTSFGMVALGILVLLIMAFRGKTKRGKILSALSILLAAGLTASCVYWHLPTVTMTRELNQAAKTYGVSIKNPTYTTYIDAEKDYLGYIYYRVSVQGEGFEKLTHKEMVAFFKESSEIVRDDHVLKAEDIEVLSDGHTYQAKKGYPSPFAEYFAFCDGEAIDPERLDAYYEMCANEDAAYYAQAAAGGSSGGKCSRCNGTGSVRYNYGSSDLEAILSGHDPYTYGQCGSCGGTGRAK